MKFIKTEVCIQISVGKAQKYFYSQGNKYFLLPFVLWNSRICIEMPKSTFPTFIHKYSLTLQTKPFVFLPNCLFFLIMLVIMSNTFSHLLPPPKYPSKKFQLHISHLHNPLSNSHTPSSTRTHTP